MKLHLNFNPEKPGYEISHHDHLFLTGSCFTEHIGDLLKQNLFNVYANPYGIAYHPLAISQNIIDILTQKEPEEDFYVQRGNRWYSLMAHSSVHASSKSGLSDTFRAINTEALDNLRKAGLMLITFGTAYQYRHKKLKSGVFNCQKLPAEEFTKECTPTGDIVREYEKLCGQLHQLNPNLKIIFTVSPVKHLREGVVQNSRSKATLLYSIHELLSCNKNTYYFPAYELVNDDLRDYRFYKEDLAHPNPQAIDYVWEKFSATFFTDTTRQINLLAQSLYKALNHRPREADPESLAKWKQHTETLKNEIKKYLPAINFN